MAVRPAAGPAPRPTRARPRSRAARAVRPRGGRRPADRAVLRRHAPAAGPGGQPDHPAAADLPRRADHRPRPAHPRPDVGHDPRARRRRLHGAAHHAVPRRGRPAGRPDRGHRPRPQGRRGHARRAQGLGRRLDACSCSSPTAPTRRSRATWSAGCSARSRCSRPRPAASTSPLADADRAADVADRPARGRHRIASVSVAKPTLDEVFLALTGHDTGDDRRARRSRSRLRTGGRAMTTVTRRSTPAAVAATARHPLEPRRDRRADV